MLIWSFPNPNTTDSGPKEQRLQLLCCVIFGLSYIFGGET